MAANARKAAFLFCCNANLGAMPLEKHKQWCSIHLRSFSLARYEGGSLSQDTHLLSQACPNWRPNQQYSREKRVKNSPKMLFVEVSDPRRLRNQYLQRKKKELKSLSGPEKGVLVLELRSPVMLPVIVVTGSVQLGGLFVYHPGFGARETAYDAQRHLIR